MGRSAKPDDARPGLSHHRQERVRSSSSSAASGEAPGSPRRSPGRPAALRRRPRPCARGSLVHAPERLPVADPREYGSASRGFDRPRGRDVRSVAASAASSRCGFLCTSFYEVKVIAKPDPVDAARQPCASRSSAGPRGRHGVTVRAAPEPPIPPSWAGRRRAPRVDRGRRLATTTRSTARRSPGVAQRGSTPLLRRALTARVAVRDDPRRSSPLSGAGGARRAPRSEFLEVGRIDRARVPVSGCQRRSSVSTRPSLLDHEKIATAAGSTREPDSTPRPAASRGSSSPSRAALAREHGTEANGRAPRRAGGSGALQWPRRV